MTGFARPIICFHSTMWVDFSFIIALKINYIFFLHVCFARILLCQRAKAPLRPCRMFIHFFCFVFPTFLVKNACGVQGGRRSRHPCINIIPPWLEGFTEVKTACPRRKKTKNWRKKFQLNLINKIRKINPRWWMKSRWWTRGSPLYKT